MRSFIVDVVLLLQFCYIAVIFRYRYIAVYKKLRSIILSKYAYYLKRITIWGVFACYSRCSVIKQILQC